jgi:hypothetical protein
LNAREVEKMTIVTDDKQKTDRRKSVLQRLRVTEIRNGLARLVSIAAGLCALVLVAGALLIALGGNQANDLVDFVKSTASSLDFGVFDRRNGVFEFTGKNGQTKNALVNWGLAAVAWLVLGRVVSGILRK